MKRKAIQFSASAGALIAISLLAPTETHAQTNWTGTISTDWFAAGNWNAGIPTAATDANINTATPNATVVGAAGATALNLAVGATGTALLTIQNGGTVTNLSGAVGNTGAAANGMVIVTGAGSSWINTGNLVVGGQGTGIVTIQNGGNLRSGAGTSIGLIAGSNGTVTVTGPGSMWTNSPGGGLNIGSFGTGTLTIANGGTVINNTPFRANIGSALGSLGTVTVTGVGSSWTNSPGVNIGNSGTGTLTIANGGVVNGPVLIAANASANGTLNIGASAGSSAAAPGALTATGVAFGAGTGTLNFNHTSANYIFAPAISGNGTVNVLAGTTVLTGANTYSGPTNVAAGTLQAGALTAFSPNSAVAVASGGTLDLRGFNQTVASLTNLGLVNMGTGTPPGTILTTNSYVGNGGTIALNTFLGGDGSPSDMLAISGGTATGRSLLRITNAGGGGALTTGNGILVVDAIHSGATAPGAFALTLPVVAGPYEYTLRRSSIDPSNPNAWYLSSALDCSLATNAPVCRQPPIPPTPTPMPPTPTPPTSSPEPPIPNFRREVSLLASLPAITLLYGRNLMDTLQERVGQLENERGRIAGEQPGTGWGRLIGLSGERSGDVNGIFGFGPKYNYSFLGLQAGHDVFRKESADGGRDHVGLYLRLVTRAQT